MRGTIAAAAVIRADAAGAPCCVLGTHATQLEWYAGCAVPLVLGEAAVREALMRGERVYVVRDLTPAWSPAAQPEIAALPGVPRVLLDEPGVISVVRLVRTGRRREARRRRATSHVVLTVGRVGRGSTGAKVCAHHEHLPR